MGAPVPRRPMTWVERELARALAGCRFPPATPAKRFAREIGCEADGRAQITERQAALLRVLVSRFRRQIRAKDIPEESRYLLDDETARRLRTRAIVLAPPSTTARSPAPSPSGDPPAIAGLPGRPPSPLQMELLR